MRKIIIKNLYIVAFRKNNTSRPRAAIFIKPGISNILDLSIFKAEKADKNTPFFDNDLKNNY